MLEIDEKKVKELAKRYSKKKNEIEHILTKYGTIENFYEAYKNGTFEDENDKKLASTMFKMEIDVDGKVNSAYDNIIEGIFGLTGEILLYSSEKLQEEIDKLGGNMKQVLEMRYGLLEGTLPKTYEEIGKELGVSKSRVEQILKKELRRMRHSTRCREEVRFMRDFNEIKSNEYVTDEEKSKIDEIEATLDKICMGEKNIDAKRCLDYLKEIKARIEREKTKEEMGVIGIDEIGFSAKAYNCLKKYGVGVSHEINHLKDLSNITEEEFLKIRGLGNKTAVEIKYAMGLYGISFKDGAEIKIEGEDFPKIKKIRLERDIKSSQNVTEEQQQEVQKEKQPKQGTSANSKEELQKTIDENDKTIYENDQALKKKLVERILEQQRVIAEQQNQISQLKSENKEL